MKNLKFTTLFTLLALLLAVPNAQAVVAVEGEVAAVEVPTLTKKQERKMAKMEKRMAKMEKRLAKRGMSMEDVDFNDPVKKWMWFWIFGWGAAFLLFIIASVVAVGGAFSGGFGIAAVLYLVGYLAGLFGTVSLIVWLVKMAG